MTPNDSDFPLSFSLLVSLKKIEVKKVFSFRLAREMLDLESNGDKFYLPQEAEGTEEAQRRNPIPKRRNKAATCKKKKGKIMEKN